MPNKASAIKALRQIKKITAKHLQAKTKMRNLERKIQKTLKEKNATAANILMREWQKACDKASKINAIKKNTANRWKSRLMSKLKNLK